MVKRGKTRVVAVNFLNNTSEKFSINVNVPLSVLFEKSCSHLGIEDTKHFGLSTLSDSGEHRFHDLTKRVIKVTPKAWNLSEDGLDIDGQALVTFYLRVKYYHSPEQVLAIKDSRARYYYHLQLRDNFITYPILYPDDRSFLLAIYAILADQSLYSLQYLDPRLYFPAWVVDHHGEGYIKQHLPKLFDKFAHVNAEEAEILYNAELCSEIPTTFNTHLYKVSTSHKKNAGVVYLGVGVKGLDLYQLTKENFLQKSRCYYWSQIDNMLVTKRKLEVLFGSDSLALYCQTPEWASYLLEFCADMQKTQLASLRDRSSTSLLTERRHYRESYIYSSDADHEWEREQSNIGSMLSLLPKTTCDRTNRYSMISAASSTTSGIVSDRTCFSYYASDSQEDLLITSKLTSSRDSLLEPSQSQKIRPVQRATSEPGKRFEQLRGLRCASRAVSDDTVSTNETIKDPIYENVNAVRSRLIAAAQAKQTKLSPRVSLDTSFAFSIAPGYSHGALNHNRNGDGYSSYFNKLNHSHNQLNQLQRMQARPAFSSQLSMVKPSPSMEQLLADYQPPPSYNERHMKLRECMLREKATPGYHTFLHSNQNISNQYTTSQQHGCGCSTTSHPEINKLRECNANTSLPMIMALCNDKNLRPPTDCQKCSYTDLSNRPISWHSEGYGQPRSLPPMGSTLNH